MNKKNEVIKCKKCLNSIFYVCGFRTMGVTKLLECRINKKFLPFNNTIPYCDYYKCRGSGNKSQ